LQWSGGLASSAQGYAQQCRIQHSNGALGPVGENLVAGTGDFTPEQAVAMFLSDGFDPSAPNFTHFTQVVWKSTTQLGCGAALCDVPVAGGLARATYYVCLYNPVGNVVGEEQFNVQ